MTYAVNLTMVGWLCDEKEVNPSLRVGTVQGVSYSQYLVHFEARSHEDESHSFEIWIDDTQVAEHSVITTPPVHSPCTPTRPSPGNNPLISKLLLHKRRI